MQTLCTRIKLRPDSLPKVRNWAEEINNRKDETLETLRAEGAILELALLEEASDGDYLIYIMKAHSLRHAMDVYERSNAPIDQFQKEFIRETWGDGVRLEKLIDLELAGD